MRVAMLIGKGTKSRRLTALAGGVLVISLIVAIILVWYVSSSSAKAGRDSEMHAEVLLGCLHLKQVLESHHKSGVPIPPEMTLQDALRTDPFPGGPTWNFYRVAEYRVQQVKWSADGTFVGVIVVSSAGSESSHLPRWEVDFAENPSPNMWDDGRGVRRFP